MVGSFSFSASYFINIPVFFLSQSTQILAGLILGIVLYKCFIETNNCWSKVQVLFTQKCLLEDTINKIFIANKYQ